MATSSKVTGSWNNRFLLKPWARARGGQSELQGRDGPARVCDSEPRGRFALRTRAFSTPARGQPSASVPTSKFGMPMLSHLLSSGAPNCHPNLITWHLGLSCLVTASTPMFISPWICPSSTCCPHVLLTCHLIFCTPTTLSVSTQPKYICTAACTPCPSFSWPSSTASTMRRGATP